MKLRETNLHGLLLAGVMLGGAGGVTAAGCMSCTEMGCVGGLRIHLLSPMDGPADAGPYHVTLVVEDGVLELDCDVEESVEIAGSPCGEGVWTVEPSREFDVVADAYDFTADDDQDVAVVFWISGWTNQLQSSSLYGPETASIRVELHNALVAEGSYAPQYTTEEINGPGCGECDGTVTEAITLPGAE